MKLKLALTNGRNDVRDVLVTADVTATIGDVARHLAAGTAGATPSSPQPDPAAELTLRVEFPGRSQPRVLRPAASVHESSLRSGCRVQVVQAGQRMPGDEVDESAIAIAKVVAGPDAGSRFTLTSGANLVGREAFASVSLTGDGEVSRRHATITVGETITVADLNSANGVTVDDALVSRAIVTEQSHVQVGSSVLQIVPLALAATADDTERPVAEFSRSPRVDPAYRGEQFTLPEVPAPGEKPRFPMLAVISPIILGAVLFLVTRQPYSLIFIALSPVIMLGSWIDNRSQTKRKKKDERARFEESLADVRSRLIAERNIEVSARTAESPSAADVADAMRERSPLLWTRKPEHTTFLEVRFGIGTQASRSQVQPPSRNAGSVDDWNRTKELADEFGSVASVPVLENLERAGAIGVAGTGVLAEDAARALVTQLAGLHSPADLVLTAFAGGETTAQWTWLTWLPHVNSPYSPLRSNGLVRDFAGASALLAELEGIIAARKAAGAGKGERVRSRLDESTSLDEVHGASVDRLPATPAIVVIVTAEAPAERARLVALGEEGPDFGVFLLWLAPTARALPVVCRTYLDVDAATGRGTVGFVRSGQNVELERMELIDSVAAVTTARALAPVSDDGARVLDETDLPHSVSFVELYEGAVTSDVGAVVQRWVKNDSLTAGWVTGTPREAGGIRAVVGQGPAEAFALDLRAHGPHALVGGTTGAGKSEFLQTWIMGIATEYSPDRVTFLLVDYKGGAAFAQCLDLPHTVGLVTDLNPHLVRRALTSLRAELTYRETLLNAKGAQRWERPRGSRCSGRCWLRMRSGLRAVFQPMRRPSCWRPMLHWRGRFDRAVAVMAVEADPGSGEPAGINRMAQLRRTKAAAVRDAAVTLQGAQGSAQSAEWAGESPAAFVSALEPILTDVRLLADGLEAQADALVVYAGQVQQIKDQQRVLQARRELAQGRLTVLNRQFDDAYRQAQGPYVTDDAAMVKADRIGEKVGDQQAALRGVDSQWDELVSWRRRADATCAAALQSGTVLGATAVFTASAIGADSPDVLLGMLTGLSATDLQILLKAHPELAGKIKRADPTAVAGWWAGMNGPTAGEPSDVQAVWITAIPGVIGNLGGVAYWARDAANRHVLDDRLKLLKRIDELRIRAADDQTAFGKYRDLMARYRLGPEQLASGLATVSAIRAALNAGTSEVPRQLISLGLGRNATAAITIGNVDTASHVTYVVPGMGTTVADSIGGWAEGAQHLSREQQYAAQINGAPTDVATVAWIGYTPPGSFDVLGVAHGDLARAGGDQLAGALNGLDAVRSWAPEGPHTAVWAHSYGSTTAADALTHSGTGAFVMAGSAGIEPDIQNVHALNVPDGGVFATQGEQDGLAPVGQSLSGRLDPTGADFGARVFSSETTIDPGTGQLLNGITRHGPLAHASASDGYSYLDGRTESLRNAALATMGFGGQVPQIHGQVPLPAPNQAPVAPG